ncbi:hypothetical protein KKP04_14805 [Rhodomicrobium sp. Az07]|uniref:hypothetical protein n=1 Tax=Rhodomicrobium sp. Az07 TaxID=2839034 RepID=UPI001BEBA310|nr:hypothetical protein [Rhodomicrobium sp. Az07]MBT3072123.1 hypothetical protein [Rhodomicrobium sp. Az07]
MPLKEIIDKLSNEMLRRLGPGDLAELRRMTPGDVEPPAYWRLAAECGFLEERPDRWAPIVRIMAILTPKGDRRPSDKLHVTERPLGGALADGGNAAWGTGPNRNPAVSEARLARFLAAPQGLLGDALLRLARMLAAKRDNASGVNCVEIATLLLSGNPTKPLREIARAYYARLDAVAHSSDAKDDMK